MVADQAVGTPDIALGILCRRRVPHIDGIRKNQERISFGQFATEFTDGRDADVEQAVLLENRLPDFVAPFTYAAEHVRVDGCSQIYKLNERLGFGIGQGFFGSHHVAILNMVEGIVNAEMARTRLAGGHRITPKLFHKRRVAIILIDKPVTDAGNPAYTGTPFRSDSNSLSSRTYCSSRNLRVLARSPGVTVSSG